MDKLIYIAILFATMIVVIACSGTKKTVNEDQEEKKEINQSPRRTGNMQIYIAEAIDRLGLEDPQMNTFNTMHKRYGDKITELRDVYRGDAVRLSEMMSNVRERQDADIKEMLNEEQHDLYMKHLKDVKRENIIPLGEGAGGI